MRQLAAAGLALAIALLPGVASAKPRVFHSQGRPLTPPSNERAAAVAAGFLRQAGRSPATVESLRAGLEAPGRAGLKHVQLLQEVNGLRVYGAYAKATVNAQGELLHLIDNLVHVAGAVRPAAITEAQALRAALAALHPDAGTPPEVARDGNTVRYARGSYFHADPTVERVVAQAGGGLAVGFLVKTWSETKNLLHHTLVGPSGAILDQELRTNTDTYNVFLHNPIVSPQGQVSNPSNAVASPAGWLTGTTHSSWLITGNNARAYLDADKRQNTPDAGGEARSTTFDDTLDVTSGPVTATNRNVAIQNLFFHNNLLHDTLYLAGFTEAFGNFQADNFSRGGAAGDPVQAEAQDGGGLDNANFATPEDGTPPRMQMYLWNGANVVDVSAPASIAGDYYAAQAEFGPEATFAGVSGNVVLVSDGTGTPTDACETLQPGSLAGAIALIDRGTCDFTVKVKNAQNAGAIGAVVANNVDTEAVIIMGGNGRFAIPASSVSFNTGQTLKSALAGGTVSATLRAADPPPGLRDGDIDADIIWHEYGHGLTWRMIGGMSGPLAGAVGEGMSDVLALIHGPGDDRVAEYSFSNPIGIRREPYDTYSRTYGALNEGTRQVHNDGEIYAAIGWRMIENYADAGVAQSDLLADLVEGMKHTPSRPAYEDMRDGILAGLTNTGNTARECLVWRAFAEYGVGVGASATESTSRGKVVVAVNESFDVPSHCTP